MSQSTPLKWRNDPLLLVVAAVAPFDAVLTLPGGLPSVVGSIPRLIFLGYWALALFAYLLGAAVEHRGLWDFLPWTVWAGASAIWGMGSADETRYLLLCATGLGYSAIGRALYDRGVVSQLLQIWIGATVVIAIVELGLGIRLPAARQHPFMAEFVGPFYNPLFTAAFLDLLVVGGLACAFAGGGGRRSTWAAITAATCFLVLRTGSRTGSVGVLVGLFAIAYVGLRQSNARAQVLAALRGVVPIGLCVIVVLVALAGIPDVLREKLSSLSQLEGAGSADVDALTSRGYAAALGLGYATSHPLLGYGPAATETLLGRDPILVAMGNVNAHNWLLEVVLNFGVIGLSLFVYPFVIAFRRWHKSLRTFPHLTVRAEALWLPAAVLVLPIISVGPSSLVAFAPMWIIAGAFFGHSRSAPQS